MAVCNSNILQPSGFRILIDRENYPNLEFQVQSVMHPSVNSTPAEMPYKRLGAIPFPGDKLEMSEVTFNLILDEELNGYTEMYNWMKRNVETNVVNQTDDGVPHSTDIILSILTSNYNISKKFVYRDCVPTGIGDVQMEAGTSDVQPILVPASFRFSYFDIA